MRFEGLEQKLIPVIEGYINDVYPDLRGKPYPAVICMDDVQFKAALKVRDRKTMAKAALNILSNTLFFRNNPDVTAVAHEVEHWAQAQEAGPDVYLQELQSKKTFREYEEWAEKIASCNAHKLTGKY